MGCGSSKEDGGVKEGESNGAPPEDEVSTIKTEKGDDEARRSRKAGMMEPVNLNKGNKDDKDKSRPPMRRMTTSRVSRGAVSNPEQSTRRKTLARQTSAVKITRVERTHSSANIIKRPSHVVSPPAETTSGSGAKFGAGAPAGGLRRATSMFRRTSSVGAAATSFIEKAFQKKKRRMSVHDENEESVLDSRTSLLPSSGADEHDDDGELDACTVRPSFVRTKQYKDDAGASSTKRSSSTAEPDTVASVAGVQMHANDTGADDEEESESLKRSTCMGNLGLKKGGAITKRANMRRRFAVSAEANENEVASGASESAMLDGIENANITLKVGGTDEPTKGDGNDVEQQQNEAKTAAKADVEGKSKLNSEQLEAIALAFKRNNLFASLDADVIHHLSLSVIPLVVKKGTVVVRQGENGNFFFIVYKGSFRCEVLSAGESVPKTVAVVGASSSFGELSLMYNCPRKASVIAVEDSEIFALERAVFTKTVVEVSNAKTRERIQFLRQVPLLANLTDSELGKLSSCVIEEVHAENTRVCNQGDDGDCMYLIFDGYVKVMKKAEGAVGEKHIANLMRGDYFGEQALLKNDVRSATVMVSSQFATLLKLAREDFEVLLGPLMNFVGNDQSKYYRMVRELPVMSSLSELEINQLLQAMTPIRFQQDDIINIQGVGAGGPGDTDASAGADADKESSIAFAIIVDGEVDVVDKVDVVRRLFRGDYFGSELSMLPQKALILRADTDLQCIALRMEDYTELMGPLKRANKKRLEELDRLKEILQSFGMVSQLDEEEVALLSDMAEEQQFSAGEHIIEAGKPNNSAYIVMEGYVSISEGATSGATFKRPGEYFGHEALVTGATDGVVSTYSAVASQQTDCVVISQVMLRTVMSKRGHTDATGDNNLFAIRVMKAVPLFSSFSFMELANLAKVVTMREFSNGDIILQEGERGNSFFILRSGTCDVIRHLGAMSGETVKDLAPQLIARLREGDFFGEISLLTSRPVTATVKANGSVEVLVMSSEDFSTAGGKLMAHVSKASKRRLLKDEHGFDMQNYNIVQVLGRGAIGTVRLVQNTTTRRYYALKSMRKDMIRAYKQEEHVINEKRIMSMLDHPLIVGLISFSASKTHLYLLIEFVQGGDFFSLLRHNGCLPEKIVKFYAACVVAALQYLHSHGIIYRDLKPENLLIDSSGYLRLTDFGLAKFVKDKTFTTCGTPEYMAPELVAHTGHDKSVDYWALGCLIHEMICGVTPFLMSDEFDTFDNILSGSISFIANEFESREVKDLISKLCQVRSVKRLGCGATGTRAVINHPFFREVDFVQLERRTLIPPFVPELETPGDTSYFPSGRSTKVYSDLQEGKELDIEELDREFSSYAYDAAAASSPASPTSQHHYVQ